MGVGPGGGVGVCLTATIGVGVGSAFMWKMSRPGSYRILRLASKISVRSRGSWEGSCVDGDGLPGGGAPREEGGGPALLPPNIPLNEYKVRGRAMASNAAMVITFFLFSAPIFNVVSSCYLLANWRLSRKCRS